MSTLEEAYEDQYKFKEEYNETFVPKKAKVSSGTINPVYIPSDPGIRKWGNDHDPVTNPAHYVAGRKYEPIDVIEDWQLDFLLGNALKYIARAGRKESEAQDLAKAVFYINRAIGKK